MPAYPYNHGGKENGGNKRFLDGCRSDELALWIWTPEFEWRARVDYMDLRGAHARQVTLVSIPALGMTAGRLDLILTGGPLLAPVTATAYAEWGEDEQQLGPALEVAVDALLATTLEGVVETATADDGDVTIRFAEGIGLVAVTYEFIPAQVLEVTVDGTLRDGDYGLTYASDDDEFDPPYTVTVPRAGTPATTDDLADELAGNSESELQPFPLTGAFATANVIEIDFEPEAEPVTVTGSVPAVAQVWTATFAGAPTDGPPPYRLIFDHESLFAPVPVDVLREAGTPTDNTALADAMQTAIEEHPALFALIASAPNALGVNTITTHVGVTGLSITTSAPAPGTLVAVETTDPPTIEVADATPDGPDIIITNGMEVDLAAISELGDFPPNSSRHEVAVEVVQGFGAGSTLTLGDEDEPAGLLGSTPIDANVVGRSLGVVADVEYRTRHEPALVPIATITLGESLTASSGVAVFQIVWSPAPAEDR